MYEYTLGNHFKLGYDGLNLFQERTGPSQKISVEYGKISRVCSNWREANLLAAKEIYDRKVGDITVLYSGGMDSEVTLRSFLELKLPVKAITLKLLDVDQEPEHKFIEKLKEEFKFDHEYLPINLNDFLQSSDFWRIADLVKCVSPIIVSQLWLAEQVSGTPIIGGGEVHLKKEVPADYVSGVSEYKPSPWYLFDNERMTAIFRFFILQNKPAIPAFFRYIPEQTYTFLSNNKLLNDLVNNRVYGKLGTRTSKNLMYKQFYPEIPLREKLHGWESVMPLHDKVRAELGLRFPYNNDYCLIEFNQMIRDLSSHEPTHRGKD